MGNLETANCEALGMGLDWKAVACVQKWRFDPAQQGGQPVAVEWPVGVDFHL